VHPDNSSVTGKNSTVNILKSGLPSKYT